MKWFKHETRRNAQLKRLIMEYGIEGYGLYWLCLELIAGSIDIKNLTFELEEDAELIAHEFKTDTIKVEKIMHRCIELGLFDLSDNGRLRCLRLAQMLDESISKNQHVKEIKTLIKDQLKDIPDTFRNKSGDPPTRVDKSREDKKRKKKKPLTDSEESGLEFRREMKSMFDKGSIELQQIITWSAKEYTKLKELYNRLNSFDTVLTLEELARMFMTIFYNKIKNGKSDYWKNMLYKPCKAVVEFDIIMTDINKQQIATKEAENIDIEGVFG